MSGDAERHGAHIDGRRGRSDRQRAPRFHAGRRAIIVGPGFRTETAARPINGTAARRNSAACASAAS
ncbi:hypothetical protein FA064_20885 [Pseudomonas aeruginosa]|nr:hypothetical protein [Pseudomonas aeruginosa]